MRRLIRKIQKQLGARKKEAGYAMVLAILMSAVLLMFGSMIAFQGRTDVVISSSEREYLRAFNLADSDCSWMARTLISANDPGIVASAIPPNINFTGFIDTAAVAPATQAQANAKNGLYRTQRSIAAVLNQGVSLDESELSAATSKMYAKEFRSLAYQIDSAVPAALWVGSNQVAVRVGFRHRFSSTLTGAGAGAMSTAAQRATALAGW